MKNIIFSIALLFGITSQASLLTYEAGPSKIESVNLNKTATINIENKPEGAKMEILGAGTRNKKVLFVNAKVYVLQIFSDNKAGFARDAGALTSLVSNSSNVALKISMLRTVDAASLATSFSEALAANGYKVEGELKQLISVIQNGASGDQGKNLSLVLSKDVDPAFVNFSYEDSQGKIQTLKVGSLAMTQVLSIWLGKPADSGLEALKASLLNPVY
jgi:hypothetical protein